MKNQKRKRTWITPENLKTVRIAAGVSAVSDFKIEKNIPVPVYTRTLVNFPLDKMEVGDSFFIPNKKGYGFSTIGNRILEIHKDPANRRYFFTKVIKDATGTVLGRRVWRKQ